MRGFWSWLGLNLGKRAGTVAVVGLLVTVVLGAGMVKLTFATDNSSYLNANDPTLTTNNRYEALFGSDPIVTIFAMRPGTTVDNLFTPANQAAMLSLQQKLDRNPAVFTVVTPVDVLTLTERLEQGPNGVVADSLGAKILLSAYDKDPSPASRALREKSLLEQNAIGSSIPVDQRVLSNPAYVHNLLLTPDGQLRPSNLTIFPNPTHATMVIYLKGGLTIAQEAQAYQTVSGTVASTPFANATTLTTGVPALLQTINDYLRGGMLRLSAIAALLMIVILLVFFTVRWRLLPFAIVTVGLIWAFGLAGYFGIPISLGSIAALPVLLGVGIDYAIQMHSRVEEEVVLDRAAHPIQATARNLGPALLVVTFDAVFAFLALWFAKVPMVRQFGELLVVGIIAVCLCSIIGPLAILGIREYKSPTKGRDFSHGRLGRTVVWLGSLPATAAVPLALVAAVVFAGGLASEGHLVLQTDPLLWVNPHAQSVQDIAVLKQETGADNVLGVLTSTSSPFSDATVNSVLAFTAKQEATFPDQLFPATGLVNTVNDFMEVPGATEIPPTGAQVEAVYDLAPPSIQRTQVADGGRYLNIIYRARTATLADFPPVITQMQADGHATPGVTNEPTGIAAVGTEFVDNLASSRKLLTYLSILFVGLFLAVRLRSAIRSLLSLVPVLIAVGTTAMVAFALGLKLSPMTAVAGPLVVAVCTEFTSLILLRFVEERGRGLAPREAMDLTASRTGRAFMVSAMAAVAGVGVLATSSMPLVASFGVVVGLNVAVALLSALVVLPPILVWADAEGRNWVSRGLLKDHEEARTGEAGPGHGTEAGAPSGAAAPALPLAGP